MSTQCIVVLGTASIQRYIFQSNRLKEIIGASYLAKHWFDKGLIASIEDAGCSINTSSWNKYTENPSIPVSDAPAIADVDVNLIYVGGGNAALLCKSQKIAKKVVKVWSLNLLKKVPGIRAVVGCCEIEESFQSAYRKALNKLKVCEEGLSFGASLGSLPVVRSCATTGLPAGVSSREDNQNEWISYPAASKRKQVGTEDNPGPARKYITNEFKSVLKEGRRFAIDLDGELGGLKGESHIAVVHADGNGMGEYLDKVIDQEYEKDTDFLHYLRAFSASVSMLSKSALEKMLLYFDALSLEGLHLYEDVFPFRPIVYGGDDLTFVCDGRVGLHLTAYYLQEFAKGTIVVSGEDQPVDACAGVAIVHSKFPIAQAYHFADELCGLAKIRRRDENKNHEEKSGSWLDFQIIQEGITESVSALRDSQYRSLEGQKLHQHRPYKVPDAWKTFVEILQAFRSKQWPRSRAKNLLQVLAQGPIETARFIEGTHWRGTILPDVRGVDANAKEIGWTGGEEPKRTTPYFDPLEALDFYLDGLLPTHAANNSKEEEDTE